jgi:hypothetical protein
MNAISLFEGKDMAPINSIDELVDKAIEEALNRTDINPLNRTDITTLNRTDINTYEKTDITTLSRTELDIEDVKKRKPKPFRYLTKEEIKVELREQSEKITTMKEPKTQIFDNKIAILGLGDIEKIENVIMRHQASRKFKGK